MTRRSAGSGNRWPTGTLRPAPGDEDVHTTLERALIDLTGAEVGGRIRAGRSRNDQIATLVGCSSGTRRADVSLLILDLIDVLVTHADRHADAVMPGRTHLQHAQPVVLGHHLLAHVWALLRDVERSVDLDRRVDASPYGAAALAGNTLGTRPRPGGRRPGLLARGAELHSTRPRRATWWRRPAGSWR